MGKTGDRHGAAGGAARDGPPRAPAAPQGAGGPVSGAPPLPAYSGSAPFTGDGTDALTALRQKAEDAGALADLYRDCRPPREREGPGVREPPGGGPPSRADPGEGAELIRKALDWTCRVCGGLATIPGSPRLSRPVIAAKALACEGLDAPAIAASLVREALALGRAGPRDVAGEFGEETASLAAGSLDQDGDAPDSDARRVERYRRLLATSLREPRALAVWLASRLFGMIAFPLLPLPQQEPFAQETLDFCAPLAGGLGLLRLKASLEDMSFSVLRPWDYRDIMSRMQAARAGRREYVAETCAALERKVREYGLPCVATGRAKHAFGIWRKMILQNLPFETILDLYSFRLRVASDEACYPALGIVHCHFPALPGRLKDYIALSAEDGYRSLHTAVVGPEGIHIEIRIGSADMRGRRGDDLEGLLAREPPCAGDAPGTVRASLGRLLETLEGAGDPASMLARFRKALDPAGPVLAFTPDGIPLKLTQGATPIDFAYMLHPLIGGRLSQAYVGGRPVELGRPLWNLSTVRIETDQGARPAPAWLSMAASPKTRAMIRRALAPPRGRARGTGL